MVLTTQAGSTSDTSELSAELHEKCQSQNIGKLFSQEDLLSLGVLPNNDLLLLTQCVNILSTKGLFKIMTQNGRTLYRIVSKEDAASYVESAGREGVWTKTIRSKSNLHDAVFTRCLKQLEAKGLIKPTQNAKHPTRKLYILSHLQPLEEVSGGPFYTDGSIDEEFVLMLCMWIHSYVHENSWFHNTPAQRRKNKELEPIERTLPYPPGYANYPKLREITNALNASDVSSVVLKEAEVLQILDLLCWDGRLERVMGGQGYRSIPGKAAATEKEDSNQYQRLGNGLVESPCGQCPVLDLCEEQGPINARTCAYFYEWMNA